MRDIKRRNERGVRRYHARRKLVIETLGGQCSACGSTHLLEVDHKSREGKGLNISQCITWNWNTLLEELKKCQLLCYDCHLKKTALENTKTTHGRRAMYAKGCRCSECVAVERQHHRDHHRQKVLRQGREYKPRRTEI